jgi:ketosteroid isomerase-like protein
MKRLVRMAAAAAFVALAAGQAAPQGALGRAPDWAQQLAVNDTLPTTGGRPTLAAAGLAFAVRVTIAPHGGGVARVIRVDGGDRARLYLRRFTGHPTNGWWMWGPDTPIQKVLTNQQRADIERLARSAVAVATGGGQDGACPRGERAFIEIMVGERQTSLSRDCLGADPGSQLASAVSALAGSQTEEDLRRAAVQELMDADRAFSEMAQRAGVAAAFAHYAAEDAHQFVPGQDPAQGRRAVSQFWSSWPEGATLSWEPQAAQVSDRGDMGWTWGRGVTTFNGESRTSRYVTVWKRNLDGEWRFVVDIGNQD